MADEENALLDLNREIPDSPPKVVDEEKVFDSHSVSELDEDDAPLLYYDDDLLNYTVGFDEEAVPVLEFYRDPSNPADLSDTIPRPSSLKIYYMKCFAKYFNFRNIKLFAFLLVIGLIIYHARYWRYNEWLNDKIACDALMSEGEFTITEEWKPNGCVMHNYTHSDTSQCFSAYADLYPGNNFVFVGDRNIYYLYKIFVEYLIGNNNATTGDGISEEPTMSNSPLDHVFVGKAVRNSVAKYIYAGEYSRYVSEALVNEVGMSAELPTIFVIGFTYHKISHGKLTRELLGDYKSNLSFLNSIFDMKPKTAHIIWKLKDHIDENRVPYAWIGIQNDEIDLLNDVARKVFHDSEAVIWESALQISKYFLDRGIKLNKKYAMQILQILLNMYCNDNSRFIDGSCCKSAEKISNEQIASFSIFFIFSLGACGLSLAHYCLLWYYGDIDENASRRIYQPRDYMVSVALTKLGIIMIYFYVCDRMNFFKNEDKHFSLLAFCLPIALIFAVGAYFTEITKLNKVFNRNQIAELKGWTILIAIIGNMTGIDRILFINFHNKLFISVYFFMEGYTHFGYIMQRKIPNFIRFSRGIFRLNFLTLILCLCMNRPYQLYHFVPQASIWLCIIYFVFCFPPRISDKTVDQNSIHYFYLLLKIIVCIVLVAVLNLSQPLFEDIFLAKPWKPLFTITPKDLNDNIHIWWNHWKLDRYTVPFGLIFAICVYMARKYGIFNDHGSLFTRRTSFVVSLLALIGIVSYSLFSYLCVSEENCKETYSYILFIPIISYIILRNMIVKFRNAYSTFFVWVGRISLEIFLCHYHIWMATDGNRVLVLIPGFPILNVIVSTFILICIAHQLNRITMILLYIIVPNDWVKIILHFVMFLLALILILIAAPT